MLNVPIGINRSYFNGTEVYMVIHNSALHFNQKKKNSALHGFFFF